jgi:hypothetical protein
MTQLMARFSPPPGLASERNACTSSKLFPLPGFVDEVASRTQRRKNSELRQVTRMADGAVKSLNWLGGCDASCEVVAPCTPMQSEVCARIWETAASWPAQFRCSLCGGGFEKAAPR